MLRVPRLAVLAFFSPVTQALSVASRERGDALERRDALERGDALHFTYQSSIGRDGATRCFVGYVTYSSTGNISLLEADCPDWRKWVTTTGDSPDKVHAAGAAIVLGQRAGSPATGRYGSIRDGGVDLGCGFLCDWGKSGKSDGVHLLSIPVKWYSDCCSATESSVAHAIAERRTSEVCPMLRDSIRGGLKYADEYSQLQQAKAASDSHLFSQCYHLKPEVWTLHLHTAAGVVVVKGVQDMGLGPEPYNACVCEPAESGGHCPTAQPREALYVAQATRSLCFNVARAGNVSADVAEVVCGACE